MRRVGIRNLNSSVIREAGLRGEAMFVTASNVVRGMLMPVTPSWGERIARRYLDVYGDRLERAEKSVREGQASSLEEFLEELDGTDDDTAVPSGLMDAPVHFRQIGIRYLSAHSIMEAAAAGDWVLVTADHRLCGLLIPVTQDQIDDLVGAHVNQLLARLPDTAFDENKDFDLVALADC